MNMNDQRNPEELPPDFDAPSIDELNWKPAPNLRWIAEQLNENLLPKPRRGHVVPVEDLPDDIRELFEYCQSGPALGWEPYDARALEVRINWACEWTFLVAGSPIVLAYILTSLRNAPSEPYPSGPSSITIRDVIDEDLLRLPNDVQRAVSDARSKQPTDLVLKLLDRHYTAIWVETIFEIMEQWEALARNRLRDRGFTLTDDGTFDSDYSAGEIEELSKDPEIVEAMVCLSQSFEFRHALVQRDVFRAIMLAFNVGKAGMAITFDSPLRKGEEHYTHAFAPDLWLHLPPLEKKIADYMAPRDSAAVAELYKACWGGRYTTERRASIKKSLSTLSKALADLGKNVRYSLKGDLVTKVTDQAE